MNRSSGRRRLGPLAGALVAIAMLGASCSSSGTGAQSSTTLAPLPAGATPSSISKMVCGTEAQKEMADPLGVKATVTTPTWTDHVYACRYTYPNGFFALSVKELSSWSQTYAYYDGLGSTLGDTGKLKDLGQGAFATTNGSIVVRKDWKVLLVDITGLPAQFGVPPTSRADIAFTIADVIMGCWAGD